MDRAESLVRSCPSGDLSLSNAKSCFPRSSARRGWILAFEAVPENCSTPLCLKLLITRIGYQHSTEGQCHREARNVNYGRTWDNAP